MRIFIKYSLLLVLLLLSTVSASAQHITVTVPSSVAAGENFRLSYTVDTQNVEEFKAGTMPSAIEVIAGPYTSRQSSYQMINGHTSSTSSVTYTYTLYIAKPGVYTIAPACAIIGGRKIYAKAVKVSVAGHAKGSNGNGAAGTGGANIRSAGSRISGNDLFIRVSANKKQVYEQEPILLTYKVYTLVELTQLKGDMPDLTGFHTQEIKLPQQKSFHIERVNGRPYRCVTWSQYVMYPQMTGKLTIPSITFQGVVVQQDRSVDPFEAFFNGGSGYVEVNKNIQAPSLSINVLPLPHRPANFSGGVGAFTISAQLTKASVKVGDPVNLRVVVSGTGNLKLIKQPVVAFPKDFEQYDAKVTDKTQLTATGLQGNMLYDFVAVPRHQGDFTIPPVELTYYHLGTHSYHTVKTQPLRVHVLPGAGGETSVDDYATKDNDIRPLMRDSRLYSTSNDFFFGSAAYIIALCLPLFLFAVLLIVFRKRAITMNDRVALRGKKANKVATKRLRKAHQLLLAGDEALFYDEILRTLWGYVSDKLNMSVELLSRENIVERLQQQAVASHVIDLFIGALDECEFERYAPGDAKGNMNKTLESAMQAITEIECTFKAKKSATSRRRNTATLFAVLIAIAMQWLSLSSARAMTMQEANKAYTERNYQQAIKDYEALLHQGRSVALYYNLGNAYYRTDNITQAILNYERALRLSPGNSDICFNLQLAQSKTIDKYADGEEMFFITWYHAVVNLLGVDGWAVLSIICVVVALFALLIYLFTAPLWLKKTGFFTTIVGFVFFVLAVAMAYQQQVSFAHQDDAIVIAPAVGVKKTPVRGGADDFVIHEGTKVHIKDRSIPLWWGVVAPDGREGWLLRSTVEHI